MYAATAVDLPANALYLHGCREEKASKEARDVQLAEEVWKWSEQVVQITPAESVAVSK